ncbi:TPA: hypothetical protein QH850_003361 [Enterobacter chengduensis]|nr:hypothetical protein [Enterobacter chengduensis]
MECKVSELVKRGHDQAAELKSSGGAVSQLISDLAAQLDVQLARSNALAAENAGLKKYICDECYVENIKTGAKKCAGLGMPETPATDAFLAEVRARGVDVAIEHLINKFEGTGRIGVPVMALEWLAKELRKGVQS